jgi:hypothetical protein
MLPPRGNLRRSYLCQRHEAEVQHGERQPVIWQANGEIPKDAEIRASAKAKLSADQEERIVPVQWRGWLLRRTALAAALTAA